MAYYRLDLPVEASSNSPTDSCPPVNCACKEQLYTVDARSSGTVAWREVLLTNCTRTERRQSGAGEYLSAEGRRCT